MGIVNTKKCYECEEVKNLTDFEFRSDTSKYRNQCMQCAAHKKKVYHIKNREHILTYQQKYRKDNRDLLLDKKKAYHKINREKILNKKKEYVKNLSEDMISHRKLYIREYRINKRENDPVYKLRCYVTKSIWAILKNNNASKGGISVMKYLPYSINELVVHINVLFEPWMTWNNQGSYNSKIWNDNDPFTWTWQLDHIIPHSTFKYTSMDCQEFRDCWSLSNLRPLNSKQNQLDGVTKSRHYNKG